MKKSILLFFILSLSLLTQNNAQDVFWNYTQRINFPVEDSLIVNPFLCAVDDNGRLYVMSTRTTDTTAHNSIYYVDKGDTVFTSFKDFTVSGDPVVKDLRGIATLDNDLYLVLQNSRSEAALQWSNIFIYRDGDTNNVIKVGEGYTTSSGYGTLLHGLAISKDSVAFAGMSFETSYRLYDFRSDALKRAVDSNKINYLGKGFPAPAAEPRGKATYRSKINDVAVIPGYNYSNTTDATQNIWYTSRNSSFDPADNITGGISLWTGGSLTDADAFTGVIVEVANPINRFDLEFDEVIPYGITYSTDNILWVARPDTNSKWVKGFQLEGNFAQPLYELPSLTNPKNEDPNGAPFGFPTDVALNKEANIAYVIDAGQNCAFVFQKITTDLDDENLPYTFSLEQNFPNPFNPSTQIRYSLMEAGNVKLTISDMLGKEIALLANEYQTPGSYSINFNGENLSSGVYFYTLSVDGYKLSKKMLLIK